MQKTNVSVDVEVVIHDGESSEGGYWAEVPGIPGCYSQADTMDEMLANIKEAIEGMLGPIPQAVRDEARRKGAAMAATVGLKSLKVRSKPKA